MEMSESIAALAASLAKAQSVMEEAKRDSDNPFFKSKYADLASVWSVCRGPLTNNGLSVIQSASSDEFGIRITTMLAHSSGEWIRDTLCIPVLKKDAQAYGSAISYGRRYALQSMVGIAAADDDDGNSATGNTQQERPPQQRPDPPKASNPDVKLMSEPQRKKLWAMMKESGLSDEDSKALFLFAMGENKTATKASQFIENFEAVKEDWMETRTQSHQ